MKRILGIMGAFLIFLSGFQTITVLAEEQKSYNSNASVGFYGQYEYPPEETQTETQKETQAETQTETQAETQKETQAETQKETQAETQKETQTETQTETQVSATKTDVSKPSVTQSSSTLPKTGDAVNALYMYGGMGIIAISFVMLRKKESHIGSEQTLLQ